MSLLMDALKKAELAKRQANGENPPADINEPLSLEPVEPPPPREASLDQPAPAAPPRLPQLPERMEDLDEQFASHRQAEVTIPVRSPLEKSDTRPRPRQAPREEYPPVRPAPAPPIAPPPVKGEQESARNLFAAKDTPTTKSRSFAVGIGIVTLMSTLGIGGYFWWQLQPKSSLSPPRPLPTPPQPVISVVPPQGNATAPVQTADAVPPAPTFSPPSIKTKSSPDDDSDEEEIGSRPKTLPVRKPPPAPIPMADSPIKLTKAPLRVNPSLIRGYELFEQGELNTAKQEYGRVLKSEPQNIDALHGMAAIALREHRPDTAEHYFQRMLMADPQEPNAIAGLANLRGGSNPAAAEHRLKGLATAQQDLAAPQFALGNMLASQERWAEAQQAYFKAYSAEPSNPDILFNLAVSLEHLRQTKLAAQYYSLAVEAAQRRPPGFDPEQAASRLRALQP